MKTIWPWIIAFLIALVIRILILLLNDFVLKESVQISDFVTGWICGVLFLEIRRSSYQYFRS